MSQESSTNSTSHESVVDRILDEFFSRLENDDLVNKDTIDALLLLRADRSLSKPTKIEASIHPGDDKK